MTQPVRTILLTGGAGYIGSHVARACLRAGFRLVILDRLCTGHTDNLPESVDFFKGDVADETVVGQIFQTYSVDAVVHMAGSLISEESVRRPDLYYENNAIATFALAKSCIRHGVNRFIYSSSAAVYGQPETPKVSESDAVRPLNPYGRTKRIGEMMLEDLSLSTELRFLALRYFNVAGVTPDLSYGPRNPGIKSLFTAVCDTILGLQDYLEVYGADCDTADGSCVRDFIDVRDLAEIHVLAVKQLLKGHTGGIYNCGYSRGISVFEVINAARRVTGKEVPVVIRPKRNFDAACVVADCTRLNTDFDWRPSFGALEEMFETTLAWRAKCLDSSITAL